MNDIKVGDIVDVTYRAKVEWAVPNSSTLGVAHASKDGVPNGSPVTIWRTEATKVKPELPTAFGSVVEVDGVKYVLDKRWHSDGFGSSRRLFCPEEMAELDYTVLRDGI